ncbi:CPXCG motif-containing cysteine-rich protein [Motiliproteus sediminis]|uniref:CPXCG motif-containing cysteine-rich protein n=1 Tax=Motiliproteus sediminis TaxID=1468178 RepID=UPI001AEFC0C0|nr:CPXCG motif-containing cysteine-rich protein [Motiliproteus sediminis]
MVATLLYPCAVICPYCGEENALELEFISESQALYHDCAVCCRPMVLELGALDEERACRVEVYSEDD